MKVKEFVKTVKNDFMEVFRLKVRLVAYIMKKI